MILCLCEAVSDRTVQASIQGGCDTLPAVMRACGAGTDCGACCGSIRELIQRAKATRLAKARPIERSAVERGARVVA